MKRAKLWFSVFTLVLSPILLFRSCTMGITNIFKENNSLSGTAGFLLTVCFIAGAVAGLRSRRSRSSAVWAAVLYALGGIIGMKGADHFADLRIWSVLSTVLAIFYLCCAYSMRMQHRRKSG